MRTFSSVQLGGGAALGLWLLALVILAELWGNGPRHALPTATNDKVVDRIVARSTALPIDDWNLDVFGGDWKPPTVSPPGWIPPLAMREPAQQPTDQPVMGTAREMGDAAQLRKPVNVNNGCSPGGVRQTFYVRGVQHWRCRY
jgi:hypothetical protein